MNKTNKYLWP